MAGLNFLHGIEVIDIDNGVRPIRTQRMSVIGLIGTAPDADPTIFPLNTPVMLAGRELELLAALGARGTLPWSLDGIFDNYGATVVVIRVPKAPKPRTSVFNSVVTPRVAIKGEVVTRSTSNIDPLFYADVIGITRVWMGDDEYTQNVDWKRTGDAIEWLTYTLTESVIRRVGTTDPLEHQDDLLNVDRIYLGTTEYVKNTDFTVTENGIEWQAGQAAPDTGDEYYVLYDYGKRPANGNAYQVDYSHFQGQKVDGEVVNRTAGTDVDTLANADIIRVTAVKQGATTYVQGDDWSLTNGKEITWVRNAEVETVTRGATSTDALANAGVLEITEVSMGATQYTEGVDWQQNGDQVEWLAGASPAQSEDYTVTYVWSNRPADNADYTVDYSFRTGEIVALPRVIGGVLDDDSYEGMYALLAAQSEVKATPRLLIAPGFTQYEAVVSELIGIAEELRAVIIADGPNTTDQDAISYRENFGSKRVYIVDPWVKFYNTWLGDNDVQPVSARVAGLINKVDDERGFWWSPSNKVINGTVGTARGVSFTMGNRNSRANILNSHDVTTIIEDKGYILWGNRTCARDPRYAFLNAVRIDDAIEVSLQEAMRWAVDRNLTRTFFEEVSESVEAYLRSMAARGVIILGNRRPVWADPQLNTPDQLMQGRATFSFDYDRPYPAEHIVFQRYIESEYLRTIFQDANFLPQQTG